MKSTLTTKGQVTIPLGIRTRLRLHPGDVLEFDEHAPYLKATKCIAPEAWDNFGRSWKDPWPRLDGKAVLEELRGPVELPPEPDEK
jgi:AbrB family looped-hinge helix DNA binding protein